jgi:hypothetical protein
MVMIRQRRVDEEKEEEFSESNMIPRIEKDDEDDKDGNSDIDNEEASVQDEEEEAEDGKDDNEELSVQDEEEEAEDEDDDEDDKDDNSDIDNEELSVQDEEDEDDDSEETEGGDKDSEEIKEEYKYDEVEEEKETDDDKLKSLNNENKDDDFALEIIEEELQEFEDFESEFGSLYDDVLTEKSGADISLNDDQMDGDLVGSNGDISKIISLPSTDSNTDYYNQHWNSLLGAVLLVCVIALLAKFCPLKHGTKHQRRRNVNHKRLPTIEDDDSSA